MSLKLTFFDGVSCIGGNKILLEEDESALILDFGINFNDENKYFDEFLRPRSYLGIYDLFHLNLIPPLKGVYREDLIIPEIWENFKNHPWYREINPIAILVSHAHLDHVGYLSYLHEDIPIITSLISSLIIKSLEDTSRIISDLCLIRRKTQENGVLKTERNKFIKRPYITFGNGSISKIEEFWNKLERKDKRNIDIENKPINIIDYETYKIGSSEITYFPVDHSIPGAVSFAINTKIGWVVYTGDLRLHGRNKDHSEKFIEKLKEIPIKVLICEGTHPKVDRLYTEEDVKENIYHIVKNSKGYIIADFGARNIDRLMSFLEIAKEVGKRLVLTLKDIYLLEALSLVGYPDPKEDEYITFYKKPKGSYETWEENLLDRHDIQGKGISAKEIRNNPDDFILCMSYYDFHILLDILPHGGTYIFSSSEAFNEEMKIDQKKIENWLNYFHIEIRGNLVEKREESPFHASGHIHGDGIIKLVDYAKPEYLIPIHTERDKNIDFFDQFKDFCKVIYPKKGETITII